MFGAAWLIAALVQPLNALAFATDGIHWGTGDYAYLRNAMLVATPLSLLALWAVTQEYSACCVPTGLAGIWLATGFWTTVRAGLGLVRIWPGIGNAPLRHAG
jgi:MATE family multidrug resistance protein